MAGSVRPRRRRTASAGVLGLLLIASVTGCGTTSGTATPAGRTAGAVPSLSPSLSASLSPTAGDVASAGPTASPAAPSPAESPSLSPSPSPSPPPPEPASTPSRPPAATPAPVDTGWPALVGAIGDSYTQAWDAAPGVRYDQPAHSWATGTAAGDGVNSIVERLRARGARPLVVDAAASGRKMSDATRQAGVVLLAARQLRAPQTALVTFELGTNDLCDWTMTSPATFEAQYRAALGVLRNGTTVNGVRVGGLPPGSRLLALTLPDFARLRALTLQSPAALRVYGKYGQCQWFLGSATTKADIDAATARWHAYDEILVRVCREVEATDGRTGRLHCRTDLGTNGAASLFNRSFTLASFSPTDYFHPSLAGQNLLAASAWAAGYWPGR